MRNEFARALALPALVALAVAGIGATVIKVRSVRRKRRWALHRATQGPQRIVIVGAGFAGTHAACALARELRDAPHIDITLVDQNDYLLFTPMLTEAAGGELAPRDVVTSLHDLPRRVRFLRARIDAIDIASKRVTTTVGANGPAPATRALGADHLVLALGAGPNFHGMREVEAHSLTMKTVGDALAVRNRTIEILERANAAADAAERQRLLTVVVGGAGYTGVETMAAVNDAIRDAIPHYANVRASDVCTVLIDPGERLLPELSADLASYAEAKLRKSGVVIRFKTKIVGAGDGYVDLEGGERLSCAMLVWAGGEKPGAILSTLACKRSRHGAVVVEPTCEVLGHAGVWAIGDCAEIPTPGAGAPYAPTAQNATREGALVAKNIIASLRGQPLAPFVFRPLGELALVGKRVGVARVYGIKLSGFVAWAMWRAVYLAKMPSRRQRARIVLDWALDAVLGRRQIELPNLSDSRGAVRNVPTPPALQA